MQFKNMKVYFVVNQFKAAVGLVDFPFFNLFFILLFLFNLKITVPQDIYLSFSGAKNATSIYEMFMYI